MIPSGTRLLNSPDEARAWVKEAASHLKRPCLVLLEGDLGAGKTQFVRWFLEELGVGDTASPTFAIHHRYQSASGPADHVDLYRLDSDEDLESSGFWDLLDEPQGLLFVEWADRLAASSWPKTWRQLHIRLVKSGSGEERSLSWAFKTP